MPITPQPLALNPLKDMAQVDEIDYMADFGNLYSRMDDFDKFFNTGKISYNMLKYIPGLAKISYQGKLSGTETRRKYVDESYKNKKVIEFNVRLTANHYTNFQNVHLCFPIKTKSVPDNDNDIAGGVILVNEFFAHWIKEIDIKRYGDDIPILSLTNAVDVYRYSDELLKNMPKNASKTIENDLLYSKKKVAVSGNDNDRCAHYTTTNATAGNRTDENLTATIEKFQDQLKEEYVYRIPLKDLCNLVLGNQCFKFNTKFILTLETDMQKLFETNRNQTADALPRTVDADTSAPYIMYEQFKLDNNFRTYLEGVMLSEHVLGTGIKPTPYQKSFELVSGTESRIANFQVANKQFSFLSISLVYDKSDQHRSIYDSYNAELARTKIKSIKLENASNPYSSFNSVKFNTSDAHNKYLLHTQFVAWYCKGSKV